MTCNDIQETLLTDYPDRQLDTERAGEIESHLSSCVQCRKISGVVCSSLVEPFTGAGKISISHDKVWDSIIKQIKEEQPQAPLSNPLIEILHRARQAITLNRPAFALLAIALIALIAIGYFNTRNPEVADLSRPSETGAKSISSVADVFDHQSDDDVDYGTDIEKYFL